MLLAWTTLPPPAHAAGNAVPPSTQRRPSLATRRPVLTGVALEKRIEGRRKRVRQLLDARKFEDALTEVTRGRIELRESRRQVRRELAPVQDPAYRRDVKALGQWWSGVAAKVRAKKISPDHATRELTKRREALQAKHKATPKPDVARQRKRDEAEASALLMVASLDDLAADAHVGLSDTDSATAARISAGRQQLQAHRLLGHKAEVVAASEALLKAAERDPSAVGEAATGLQDQREWKKAVGAYRRAVDLWESGRGRRYVRSGTPLLAREHTAEVALRYRQLAHCLTQLKQKGEAEAAMVKAAEWERQPRRNPSR